MGVDPLTIGLAIGGAALGTFKSVDDARRQNAAAKRSSEAAKNAAAVQAKQLTEQEAQQRAQRVQEARRLRASILAAGGASGFDLSSGDFTDAIGASDAYAAQDLDTLATNLQSNIDRVYSGLDSQLISINATKRSAAGDGLAGGIAGLNAGLSLGQNVDTIMNARVRQDEILRIRKGGGSGGGFAAGMPQQEGGFA